MQTRQRPQNKARAGPILLVELFQTKTMAGQCRREAKANVSFIMNELSCTLRGGNQARLAQSNIDVTNRFSHWR
jgi:hypothetical protein